MNITEHEVRALVREAIERHLRPQPATGGEAQLNPSHASHMLLPVLPGSDLHDGACVVEPAVRCSHCGFCRSYGH
jgi:hypothetical protein